MLLEYIHNIRMRAFEGVDFVGNKSELLNLKVDTNELLRYFFSVYNSIFKWCLKTLCKIK